MAQVGATRVNLVWGEVVKKLSIGEISDILQLESALNHSSERKQSLGRFSREQYTMSKTIIGPRGGYVSGRIFGRTSRRAAASLVPLNGGVGEKSPSLRSRVENRKR